MPAIESKLLIFAKAPVAGAVKTRLQPAISADDAARLQTFFIQKTVSSLFGLKEIDLELYCFPDAAHPVFQQCAQQFDLVLNQQQGDDLGERMAEAFQLTLTNYRRAVVIGTDCPDITPAYVAEAFSHLRQGADAVIGPAKDGGYVLLGLQRYSSRLFANINWGSNQVLYETRERLHELGWKWDELYSLHDIDRADDLFRFPAIVKEAGITFKC